ncbi:hypothetical protein JTB14_030408 [Gonioctena quinquepunctata]|nr:hypothetical protein JTB14_030408 [Gonioctena quinquepunctata]
MIQKCYQTLQISLLHLLVPIIQNYKGFCNRKLQLNAITLSQKELELVASEREREYQTKELLEEIEALKKDNKDREDFILKLRRTSNDFEDEVTVAETNFNRKLDEQKGVIVDQRNDIKNLIKENTRLQEELETITKKREQIPEGPSTTYYHKRTCWTSIETLTVKKECYVEQQKTLEYKYFCLKEESYNKGTNNPKKRPNICH